MKRLHAIKAISLLVFGILLSPKVFSLKSDFTKNLSGLTLGGGVYQHYLPNDNAFDPVPLLVDANTTITGSKDFYIIPTRIGYFSDTPSAGISLYARYITNLPSAWTAAGTLEGTGSTRFGSFGLGAEITSYLLRSTRLRLGFSLNTEYIWQKLTLSFTPTGGEAAEFQVKTTSVLAGVGFRPEIYLGDLWALSLFTGYQYGFNKYYSAATAATFMGTTHAAGLITSPNSGGNILTQHGGFLFEAVLKLHFM